MCNYIVVMLLGNWFFKILTIICFGVVMHPQTPEKNNKNFINTFLRYPQKYQPIRQQFLQQKTSQQIRETSAHTIQQQYQLLCHADINDNIFNVNHLYGNRYTDIYAYEHSRVRIDDKNDDYYINGNQVRSIVDDKVFAIFSQAPYKVYDSFWEAVYYKGIDTVIMLCKFYDPNRGHQSEQYWPDAGSSAVFSNGSLKVTTKQTQKIDEQFVVNTFTIEGKHGIKTMKHYHWTGWSDLKKPIQQKMHNFQFLLELCFDKIKNDQIVWIHCSAGIGRTGTLGGVVDGLRYYQANKRLSIFGLVENMRKYRYHAVQTLQQYKFLYSYIGKRI